MNSLPQLVRAYKQTGRPRHQAHLDFYRSLDTLEEAIKRAAQATGEDGEINGHQRRVGRVILGKASKKLLRKAEEIESCTSFHDLIELVERVTARIDRFGELAVYDTSLRIGSWLDLLPERVYIHAGTRKGAKALGLSATDGYVEADRLPSTLRTLPAHEVEDFLCIFKDELKSGKVGTKRGACGPTRRGRVC